MKVLQEKVDKVQILKAKVENIVQKGENLESNSVRVCPTVDKIEEAYLQKEPIQSFAAVANQKQNRVVRNKLPRKQASVVTKPSDKSTSEKITIVKEIPEPKQGRNNSGQIAVTEDIEPQKEGNWTTVNKKKKGRYPNTEVKKRWKHECSRDQGDRTEKIFASNGYDFVEQPKNHIINSTAIEIYYQNVRGLRTKLEEFYVGISSSGADLFAITETGCNKSIHDAELVPPGYTIIRCDRADGRKQGGACLVATPRFELRQVSIPSDINIDDKVFELVGATVYLHNRLLFLLCVVYIPPNSCEDDYMILFRVIEQLCSKYSDIVVIGDFNMHSCSINVCNYFQYFLSYCGFTQCNTIVNSNNRCLDLVLSTLARGESVNVREAEVPLVPVDAYHPPLDVLVELWPRRVAGSFQRGSSTVPTCWNFNKADFLSLYASIATIDWTDIYNLDLEMILDYFYETINSKIDDCVPRKKRSRVSSKYVYPEFYTIEIICNIRRKAILHKQYKGSRTKNDYEAFALCRSKVKRLIKIAQEQHGNRVQNQLQKDPRSFWNHVKSRRGSRNLQKILKDGAVLSDEQCVKEFAQYFHSVYSTTRPELNVNTAIEGAGGENGIARVHIEGLQLGDVLSALKQLKPKRSAGPDGIPAYILKDCGSVLAEPLLYIFNKYLSAAVFPERWKTTRVVPIPKGGTYNDNVSGYRPIAVLSSPAKVLECAIHNIIFMQVKAQLSDAQHGFRPMRSTTSNLLSYMAHLLPTVDSGGQTDAAYFDYKKAFDLVDNDVLLKKLAGVGFTPHLLNFFASYMRDRQQYVEYAGHRSEPYFTWSGVSQGSNLGPLQFIIMINDLPKVVKDANCLLFADDLKLFLAVKEDDDCGWLQNAIDSVVNWSKENLLQFNTQKCVTITFSRAHRPIVHSYDIDGMPMVRVTEVKDLGVTLNAGLTFRDHIAKCCKKAYRNLGFLLRTVRNFTNIAAIIALYNALVRSQLECNAVIWAPHETKYSLMLERIQNKFIRFLYFRLYGVYPFYPLMYPTLFVLGMVGYNELRVRRELALVLYLFRLIRGKVHHADILCLLCLCVPDRYVWRRRRPHLLAVPRGRTKLLNEAPLMRALRTLNLVAEEMDIFICTLSEFTGIALYIICYKS
ncbi:unnamed protein product [Euphydryas editha]|uniref:Reverse transcriptase domain-containing protein n=1 Tax=Euphydryas editha TaxID=104508 RepID=A0AAU9VCC2_EUPED|nr:unnamed protein product [Euphydryas editha]